ncbi:threonine aldolase family protein [Halorussus lipolyticus]|uniref:threonine aldolase family protein n=1 Tax=Halorussus lipolyticus TaxID=3034024 RepID=UPI0023E7FDEE|nr:low specificity L-threonine aldolase [Halorussus sp. DT80]
MIDLRSDTVTKPDEEMREAARDADVGDDVYGEDPTVNELEAKAADLVGFEDALYVPTGTMGNQVAVRTHTDRGQEVMIERESHVYKWELGGLAQLSSLQVRTLDGGERGIPTPEQVREGYVEEDAHRPGSGLLTLENTHNSKGGVAIDPEKIDAAAEAAHELGLPVHLDGARVMNAAVARDVPPERMTESVDSVMFCLSKGLGAPVGSILAGSEEFISRARRNRKLFGGGMRQAGIVAGPGLLSLENVARLEDDHENARILAEQLAGVEGLSVQDPETNIVLVNTENAGMPADEFLDACEEVGVRGTQFDTHVARFCTHWDVDREDVEDAAEKVGEVVDETP